MKKNLLRVKIFFLFLSAGCIMYYQHSTHSEESNLTLANIEALAQNEGGGVQCIFTGSVDCPLNSSKVYTVLPK